MLQRVRYGYVDSASNYTFTYEGDIENDDTLYPGEKDMSLSDCSVLCSVQFLMQPHVHYKRNTSVTV